MSKATRSETRRKAEADALLRKSKRTGIPVSQLKHPTLKNTSNKRSR